MVEIPILEIVLSRPLPIAVTTLALASAGSMPTGSMSFSASSLSDSHIRYGLMALAP